MSAYDPLFDEDDLNHDSNYCQHGTFIGNPFGGDYMCHWCEMGEEPPTQFELDTWEVQRAERSWNEWCVTMQDLPGDLKIMFTRIMAGIVDRNSSLQRAWDRLNGFADTTRMSGY